MRFTKMHALGNDYAYINCFKEKVNNHARLAKILSNRHTGIGGDGIILIMPSTKAALRMRIFNADGSEAEMCGNGIRCVAKYAYENKLVSKPEFDCETKAGIKHLVCHIKNNKVETVTVNMGIALFETRLIPMRVHHKVFMKLPLATKYKTFLATGVSMGNPHCVIFTKKLKQVPLELWGPEIEHHKFFPNRTNVEFVQIMNNRNIAMRVWERGSGVTLACGTGACAAAVAAMAVEKLPRKLTVHLQLGTLLIEWLDDDSVLMTGPATEVFSGEININ